MSTNNHIASEMDSPGASQATPDSTSTDQGGSDLWGGKENITPTQMDLSCTFSTQVYTCHNDNVCIFLQE